MDADLSCVSVRGKRYPREVPDVVPPSHFVDASPAPGSRWAASASTFGPLGRLGITFICLAPVLLLLLPFLAPGASLSLGTALFLFMFSVGTAPVAVWVLRDLWRRGEG